MTSSPSTSPPSTPPSTSPSLAAVGSEQHPEDRRAGALRSVAANRHEPALDGIRAFAVALVIAYHGGLPGLRAAGFLGVDIFFVLSGFLITRLLLDEEQQHGRIAFGGFWARRARRLLPALLVVIVAVQVYAARIASPGTYPGMRADAFSVLTYTSNWHFISASSNYFSVNAAPSLLTHTWSLAIEEQFYLVWPLLVWGAARISRRRAVRPATIVFAFSSAGAVLSAVWMAVLYRSGTDPSRLYYGTDTHAQCVLVGCALAAGMVVFRFRPRSGIATVAGFAALSALVWAACSLGGSDRATFEGGFFVVALLAATLVACADSAGDSLVARMLSFPPAAYVGRISYGMYLWYFPLFAVLDHAHTGLKGMPLFALRCGADVALAATSFHLVEQPVRRWASIAAPRRLARKGTLLLGGAAVLSVAGLVAETSAPVAAKASASSAYSASSASSTSPASSGVSSLPSAAASGPAGLPGEPGLRILVFGDSTGATLGDDLALSAAARTHRIVVGDSALFGCGLVVSASIRPHGLPTVPPPPCRAGLAPQTSWPSLLRASIAQFRPSVVLIAAGRWEVQDRQGGSGLPWVNISEAGDAAYVRSMLNQAASTVLSGGADVGLATAPCFASGEQSDGNAWPEDSPSRVREYNSLVRDVGAAQSAAHPGRAVVVDINTMVCPRGRFESTVDGVTVRAPDGVHYPYFDFERPDMPSPDTLSEAASFGSWIEPRILEGLAALRH